MRPQDHMSSSIAAKPQPPPHRKHIPKLYSLHVLHGASPKSRNGGQEGGHGHDPAVEEGHLAEVVEGGIVPIKQQGCQGEEEQQPVEQDHLHRAAPAGGCWGAQPVSLGAGQVEQGMLRNVAGESGVSAEQRVGVQGWSGGRCCLYLTLYKGLRMDWFRWEEGYPTKGGEWW